MPKLDVGVGDEFPTEDGAHVHHHHYYHRQHHRHGPLHLLRVILTILMIVLLVRLAGLAWNAPLWLAPPDHAPVSALYPLGGVAAAIAVLAVLLWLLRRMEKS